MKPISVDTASVITKCSRRTWWRRIADGAVGRVADDARGRAMLSWADVAPQISPILNRNDLGRVLQADAGDADAQSDMGALFSNAGQHEAALYWLQQAAQQGNADAMQWLGGCYLCGQGVAPDENLGIMWIAKAASHGHLIAQAQMNAMRSTGSEHLGAGGLTN